MKKSDFGAFVLMVGLSAIGISGLVLTSTENGIAQGQGMQNMPGMNMSKSKPKSRKKRTATKKGKPEKKHNMANMPGMNMSQGSAELMPGMLTPRQMEPLRSAKDDDFDHLFLQGMIQHHNGALTMVKDLFDSAGAGQDAELFNFATDADNTQRAEIQIMQTMLKNEKAGEQR